MIKEIVKNVLSNPPPSQQLSDYIEMTKKGNNNQIPLYGQRERLIVDFLPTAVEGDELVGLSIPWGQARRLEKIYYVRRTASGEFNVTDAGFCPHAK